MRITKEMIGQKVRYCTWEPADHYILKDVGLKYVIVGSEDGLDMDVFDNDDNWEFYEEPEESKKNVKRMAPALFILQRLTKDCWLINSDKFYFSSQLYASAEEAREDSDRLCYGFVKWPANETSWVEVEIEE